MIDRRGGDSPAGGVLAKRAVRNQDDERPVILLVEDNPADVELARHGFRAANVPTRLEVATDGTEALDFLYRRGAFEKAPRPHLVLLDLNLPGIDGREVLRQVKGDPKLADIPVVMLSTSSAANDVMGAYKDHANAYMTKPVEFERFCDFVKGLEAYWFRMVRLPPE